MKAIHLKARAYCFEDIKIFCEKLSKIGMIKIEEGDYIKLIAPFTDFKSQAYEGSPDITFEFKTHITLKKVLSIIKNITDAHAIYETINFEEFYTGARLYSNCGGSINQALLQQRKIKQSKKSYEEKTMKKLTTDDNITQIENQPYGYYTGYIFTNELSLSGSQEEIDDFTKEIKGRDNEFEFINLLPMPSYISFSTDWWYIKYGLDSPYSFNTIYQHNFIVFETSLRSPIRFFENISHYYQNIIFSIKFYNNVTNQKGTAIIHNGEIIKEEHKKVFFIPIYKDGKILYYEELELIDTYEEDLFTDRVLDSGDLENYLSNYSIA